MPDRRLEREAVLTCPSCGGTPYVLYRRQMQPESPIWEHVLWPTHPDVAPPRDDAHVECPTCRVALRRTAP